MSVAARDVGITLLPYDSARRGERMGAACDSDGRVCATAFAVALAAAR